MGGCPELQARRGLTAEPNMTAVEVLRRLQDVTPGELTSTANRAADAPLYSA